MSYSGIGLDTAEKQALDVFIRHLGRRVPKGLERVALFGSKARGESHPRSDIDVLVVIADKSPTRVDAVYDAVIDTLVETGVYLSTIVYGREEFSALMARRTLFMQDIAEEAILLWPRNGGLALPQTT